MATNTHDKNQAQLEIDGALNFSNPAFKAYAAGQFLIFAEARLHSKERLAAFPHYLIKVSYVALALICLFLGYATYQTETDSLMQSYSIEIAAGATTFLAFPLVFIFARKRRFRTYALVVVITAVSVFLSAMTSSVTRSFFIEAAAGFMLLMALDVGFNYILELLDKIRIAKEEEAAQLAAQMGEAEETLNPICDVALRGGTVEETIQFELIKKHQDICQILMSDEPYLEDDFVSLIHRVNELKKNNQTEYCRLKAWASYGEG